MTGVQTCALPIYSHSTKKWLHKSRRSSGGLGVRDWDENEKLNAEEYLEEFIPGESMSAIYDSSRLLGVTRQLIGEPWLHAKPYGYCGNISRRAGSLAEPLQVIGQQFIRHFGLCDIWGIDFIERDQQPVVVEINPRYTASLEVLQFGKRNETTIGKAIYFAAQTFTFPASGPWQDSLDHCTDIWLRPDFADIPAPGAHIEKGQPVLTILDEAESEVVLIEQLKSRAAELDKIFNAATEPQS